MQMSRCIAKNTLFLFNHIGMETNLVFCHLFLLMCFDLTILGWKHKEKIDTEIKKYEFRFNHIGMETLFFSALFWVDLQSFDLTILGWKLMEQKRMRWHIWFLFNHIGMETIFTQPVFVSKFSFLFNHIGMETTNIKHTSYLFENGFCLTILG